MRRNRVSCYPAAGTGIHRRCAVCGTPLRVLPEGQMRCSLCGRAKAWTVGVNPSATDPVFAVDWGPPGLEERVSREPSKR
jgi:ribosomal protein S14